MYDDAAKERQKQAGGDRKSEKAKSVVGNCTQPIATGRSRDQVGQAFGVSGGTVDRARVVIEKGIPEIAQAVDAGKISVHRGKEIATSPKHLQKELFEEAERGPKGRPSPTSQPCAPEPEREPQPNSKVRGKGIELAHEAIACLKQIPKNDALRKRGFQVVTDWIEHNQ